MTKRALIVGASRGIGLALASELAGRGWQVVATARNAGSELADAAIASVAVELVDIDDDASVDALVARLAGERFDLVLVNAGVTGPRHGSAAQVSPDEVAALFGTNAIAPVRLARKMLPSLNIGSTLAFTSSLMGSVADNTSGGMELYRASKAALNSLTRSLAPEAATQAITVLTLHPGWVKTAMGGPNAPVSADDSARGLAAVIEAPRPAGHYFLDYQGATIPW